MIPYYGRHPTKEFIRGKPIRWGYKAWVPAEPLGYAYHIDKDDLLSFTRSVAQQWLKAFENLQKNVGRPRSLMDSQIIS